MIISHITKTSALATPTALILYAVSGSYLVGFAGLLVAMLPIAAILSRGHIEITERDIECELLALKETSEGFALGAYSRKSAH